MEFRKLRADEISVRIGTKTLKNPKDKDSEVIAFTLLLYKDARCDMNILDETFGAFGWQRKHYQLGEDVYCSVGIYDKETKQWIWKDDCGSAGNFEQEKSKSSDSFKRACFNIGIGRELYTCPTIRIKDNSDDFYKFRVGHIAYNENNEISELLIEGMCKDGFKWVDLFTYGAKKKLSTKPVATKTAISDADKLAALQFKTKKGSRLGDLDRTQLTTLLNYKFATNEEKKNAAIVIEILDGQEENEFLTLETAIALGFED